ncbi:hypothetical protein MANES_10G131300v8 [Manihot esculenta]|uniref:Uncharacterized protein n=1 Tax=Manihot esculenta TaxID=3983 RepID=A0ACB7H2F7_MANES|nr:hypothetical protein MANES_10G131300v8 [Manihot esculenta]
MTELETGYSIDIQNVNIDGDFESHNTADGLNQRVAGDGLNVSEAALSIDDQEGDESKKDSSNQRYVNVERIFLITNFVMELPSAIFDQLSSVQKPQYALISMIISFTVMFICIIDLARTGRRERVKLMMRGHIPWFYSPSPSHKPLGTFVDIVGLVCGIFQCVFAAIAYAFLCHKAQSPIKICVWPLIFASGVLWSRFPRNAYNDDEKDADVNAKVITVYKVDMHCEDCSRKIRRTIELFEGVEAVETDSEGNTLTVTGKVDPMKIKAKLEKKTKRKVDILS